VHKEIVEEKLAKGHAVSFCMVNKNAAIVLEAQTHFMFFALQMIKVKHCKIKSMNGTPVGLKGTYNPSFGFSLIPH